MEPTTISSKKFDERASEAREAAGKGPVFITDGGEPTYVLLTIEDYRALTSPRQDIATLLAMPDMGDFELAIPHRRDLAKPAELE